MDYANLALQGIIVTLVNAVSAIEGDGKARVGDYRQHQLEHKGRQTAVAEGGGEV